MKKILFLIIFAFLLVGLGGCKEEEEKSEQISQAVLNEQKASFRFFWETQVTDEGLAYGLIPDRYPSNGLCSIASVGYGLTAFPIGVKNGWIKMDEARQRTLDTLIALQNLEHVSGFFYHFYNQYTGLPSSGSEVSNIDTAILLCGALFAGQYFGGEVMIEAQKLYDRVDWNWYVNPSTNMFYMGYDPKTQRFSGAWDVYGEQLMMYFLAAGSKTHPITKTVYDSFRRQRGTYGEETFIYSWFGSIFTYQFSHGWIDFRNMVDADGIDWFENSVKASRANYRYTVDNPMGFKTFSALAWGMTACDGPNGYSGKYGAPPAGGTDYLKANDGTIPPAGALGSIAFVPELVIPAVENYATILDGALIGEYGFMDAFNLEGEEPWIASSVIGIDKGITVVMIENYRSEFVWDTFMKLDFMNKAIDVLGYQKK